ncbi:SUMF1/EgtB/PvdO family nonheme iron enzyme [Acinetobacter calcoaceticus]|uniref:formylglycine-generating enzyme family protein n=1 Tax=Acinetobacter calcoaceticus TaxID=471 RepID=UPI002855D5AE|nr:SUMF1/EgtB/PvdO family nonheme iron enzyme [Acinetobacter calcoaceticus]MDR6796038.1 formylglycine-generating enzyme required for sulfatase activity [Acinetobacter calcoaceticus]
MMKQNIAVVLFSSLALSVCAKSTNNTQQIKTPTTNQNLSSEQQKKLQQLLDKTKKNLVEIKGGTFMMGDFGEQKSPDKLPYDSDADSKPLHKVTLDNYALSATKTTYADFDIYTEVTGQDHVGKFDDISIKYRIPNSAAGINWQQARNYCQWLGKQLNLKMDLPTEAQWEYAARNRGQYILYPTNNGNINNGKNVWSFQQRSLSKQQYHANKDISILQQFPATPLGLYDMITDNYEWMLDWYDPQYYSKSPEKNPKGPAKGTLKVVRSAEPSDGQNLQMFGGFTFSRHALHPIEDPKLSNDPDIKKYNIDLNRFNSVRCAVTY